MSAYKYSQIERDVRILLDENEDNTPLLEDLEPVTLQTEKMIREHVLQSIDEVFSNAQLYLLNEVVEYIVPELEEHKPYGKCCMVPLDFLRFVVVNAPDWMTPVYDPIDQDSDEYQMQRSPFIGIRGNKERPVVAIVPYHGRLKMEVYETDNNQVQFGYIQKAQAQQSQEFMLNGLKEDITFNIPDLLYKAVCYTIAKYYLLSVGDTEKATSFGNVADMLIGNEPAVPVAAQ